MAAFLDAIHPMMYAPPRAVGLVSVVMGGWLDSSHPFQKKQPARFLQRQHDFPSPGIFQFEYSALLAQSVSHPNLLATLPPPALHQHFSSSYTEPGTRKNDSIDSTQDAAPHHSDEKKIQKN